ncbi:MAG: MBL fold metallo-hydrolase, partial [Bacteroidaceae bacterium]|nr:MBL fold metallo-hydrolase [Bacteroidaceae bacterium]
ATCLHPEVRQIWLCHLSEENNHPELARKTISAAVEKAGIDWEKTQLNVLRRTVPSALHEL